MKLAEAVYAATAEFPSNEMYGITSQMRRSVISIPSNIAEGTGRHGKDYIRFVSIALGSTFELETQIELAQWLEYFNETISSSLSQSATRIAQMLNALRSALLSRYS